MEINQRNIKLLSTIGPRASFGLYALDLIKKYNELMILSCDVSTSAGLDRYRKQHKDNYLELGISEQNMIGVATGLARENYKVITTTFAPFQTMRCCEQIKVNLGYMKEKVTMVGLASGLVLGNLGFTHCCVEDVGVLRSIPNITIISPADSLETIKAIEASMSHSQSCYIRLTGGPNNPIVYDQDYDFKIGKAIKLINGDDITIFSTGATVATSIKISKALKEKKINASVINLHTIKPIDKEIVLSNSLNSKLIVTLEEHNIIGGLGSAVLEALAFEKNTPRKLIFGINDNYVKSGSYNFLKKQYKLDENHIIEKIEQELNE